MAGRPRDHRLDSAIAAASTKHLRRAGYRAFSIGGVAKDLAVPRSTIYARWRNSDDLLDGVLSARLRMAPVDGDRDLRAVLGEMLAEDLAVASGPEGRAATELLLAAQDPAGPAAARVQEALATRRRANVDLLTAHGMEETTATTSVDLALSIVWGRTVLLNAVAGFDADRIYDLLFAPIVGSAGKSTNRRP
jgi:AcrR family transcriptional regulator